MKHGFVISDLHLFAHRSNADHYEEAIRKAASKADFFVLNGDVFDFRWSTLQTFDHTLNAAVEWLTHLANDFPNCCFFYIMGNHDGLQQLADRLDPLVKDIPNLEWHKSHIRIGNALFMHGDLALNENLDDPFIRPLRLEDKTNSKVHSILYRILIALRLHKSIGLIPWRKYCARQILGALIRHNQGLDTGIRDIYFGHTHVAFSDYRFKGVCFHNTGATIRGLCCNILAVRT